MIKAIDSNVSKTFIRSGFYWERTDATLSLKSIPLIPISAVRGDDA